MQNHKGFTLLEVMVAVGILIVGLMAVITLLLRSIQTSSVVIDRSTAITLSEAVFEGVRAEAQSDFFSNNLFELYNGTGTYDCLTTGSCIFGFDTSCINASCNGFAAGCATTTTQKVIPRGTGTTGVYFDSTLGYFQLNGTNAQCDAKLTRFVRVLQTSIPTDPNTFELCATTFWNGNASSLENCELIADPRSAP